MDTSHPESQTPVLFKAGADAVQTASATRPAVRSSSSILALLALLTAMFASSLETLLFCLVIALLILVTGRKEGAKSEGTLESARTNLALLLVNRLIGPFFTYVLVAYGQAAAESLNLPHIDKKFWEEVPLICVVLILAVARDFLDYWIHRLLHVPGFWPIHAVHHSDTDLNWTTTKRVHALEVVLMRISYIPLVVIFGLPPVSVLLVAIVSILHNAFVHVDADIHFGPFTRVIASPRFHHWHHAERPEAYNTNYANIFSFWDVIFGTYSVPGPYTGKFGFETTPGHSLSKLFFWPFLEWWGMVRKPVLSASSIPPLEREKEVSPEKSPGSPISDLS